MTAVVGHGIDLIECERIAGVLRRHGRRFLHRVLTEKERVLADRHRDPVPFVAGRWAAKEALLKMVGTGWRGRIAWTDMEILPDAMGAPKVTLRGATAEAARRRGIERVLLSITHTRMLAAASAVGLAE